VSYFPYLILNLLGFSIIVYIFLLECDVSYLCRYSWCSKRLVEKSVCDSNYSLCLDDLIPLETCSHESGAITGRCHTPRLIIGHNVSFDRSFIKEQYFVQVKAFCLGMIHIQTNR